MKFEKAVLRPQVIHFFQFFFFFHTMSINVSNLVGQK